MNRIRTSLETLFPVCGDLLLGQTRIRRVPLAEVKVPSGAHIMISNNRHFLPPSTPEAMRRRCDALLQETLAYNLLALNCEHFATFVRYGKCVCNQVTALMEDRAARGLWPLKASWPFVSSCRNRRNLVLCFSL